MADVTKLISINDAVSMGCERLRKPKWANPLDHIKIDIIDGQLGPWVHLWAPFNKECNGRDPVDMLAALPPLGLEQMHSREFVIYDGPLPTSDEYKAEVAKFAAQTERLSHG